MSIFDGNMPYTNLHELNLDWVIKNVKKVSDNIESTSENAQIATDKANESKLYAEQAQEAVQTLSGIRRRYIMLGDSYGQGWSPEEQSDGWTIRIKNILGVSNEDFYTNSIGGVGFCNTINGQNWLTMLSGINATNPETITDIVVAGGYNDKSYSTTDIISAITSFLSIAKNLYPNAIVRIGMIAYSFETTGNIVKLLSNVLVAYQRTPFLNTNGVYMNNVENTLSNSFYMSPSDKHHPNNVGLGFLAMNIINCIKTGTCDVFHAQGSYITYATGVSGGANALYMHTEVENNLVKVGVNPGNISGTFTYSSSTLDILVGTYDGLVCINGDTNKNLYQNINVIVRKTTGTSYRETTAIVYISKNEFHIVLHMLNDTDNGFYAGNITQIMIPGFISFTTGTFESI